MGKKTKIWAAAFFLSVCGCSHPSEEYSNIEISGVVKGKLDSTSQSSISFEHYWRSASHPLGGHSSPSTEWTEVGLDGTFKFISVEILDNARVHKNIEGEYKLFRIRTGSTEVGVSGKIKKEGSQYTTDTLDLERE